MTTSAIRVLFLVGWLYAANADLKDEVRALTEQIEVLKTVHLTDVTRLKREIEELKQASHAQPVATGERNEQTTLEWARGSMRELRAEMRELQHNLNSSALMKHLHGIQNDLNRALMDAGEATQLARAQEARADKLDGEVERLRYEGQQARSSLAEMRTHLGKLAKEVKSEQMNELKPGYNEVPEVEGHLGREHKLRHNKMLHAQLGRLSRSQDQLDQYQQNLQTQLLDVQRRLDRFEEPNWNLLSSKVDFLELESKVLTNEMRNVTQKVTDLDKVHASLLELREDVESIENKADNTVPEIRKEISKLDVSFAQLTAQSSYLKEDQENLRQSVKAIAVSVSNAVDRAELDRLAVRRVNETLESVTASARTHFYRLNDHILKSEANTYQESNATETVPLSELMGEVKELQPVEHEYEDLVRQLPRDCTDIAGKPGVFLVRPGSKPRDVWCDNGATLMQRRYNGTVEFNRKFAEYVQGFGDPAGEHWLGLDAIHRLTADNCSAMRIDMTDIYNNRWYAQYDTFMVKGPDTGYFLDVAGFRGNASDAFRYQNHMEFSAIDRDRDISNTNCAANYEGGWWFSHCQHVNINGKYTLGLTWFDSARNEWIAVASSEMRLIRRSKCG